MRFSTPCLIAVLVLLTVQAGAADSPPESKPQPAPETTLAPIEVTATRLADVREEATKVPVKIVVITAEEIERLGARTVQEVLQYQSGIVMYDSIGNEFEQTVDLRGFNGQPTPGVTVFHDGVRVNEPDFNYISFDLIPVEDIEKIEIIHGPGTVFGSNALAGVINITTRKSTGDPVRFAGETAGGSDSRQRHRFTAGGRLPDMDLSFDLGVTRELSGGWRRNTPKRSTRIHSRLGYADEDGTDLSLSYTRVVNKLRQAGTLTRSEMREHGRRYDATPGDFTRNESDLLALNLRRKLAPGFSGAFNAFYRQRGNILFTISRPFFPSGPNPEALSDRSYDQGGGTLQLTYAGKLLGRGHRFNTGVDYRHNRFGSATSGSYTANSRTSENAIGVFLLDTADVLPQLSIAAGLRYDRSQTDFTDKNVPTHSFGKTFHQVSPKAGIVYNPSDTLGFYFNFSQGFRPPTSDEFRGFGPPPDYRTFVTELDAVRSRNFELGARWKLPPWLEATASIFYMPVRDEILYAVTDEAAFTGLNVNVPDTLRRGVELTLRGGYGKRFDGFINFTVTKATFETDLVRFGAGGLQRVRKGDEFPLVPRHRLGFGLNFHPARGLTFGLAGTYVGSQFLLNDEANEFSKLDDYFVLNGRIAYTRRWWTAFLTLKNMTGAEYNTYGILASDSGKPAPFLAPAPGATVMAGLTFRFDLPDAGKGRPGSSLPGADRAAITPPGAARCAVPWRAPDRGP